MDYTHLFSPITIGSFTVPNRIAMAPTDLSSANADGSVSNRDISLHEAIAKGGTGLIIVGASTPDRHTGRPTVNCIAVDEDPMIPGLSRLAEAMHRHGAKCAVQIQHPGRQAAWPRKGLFSATDQVAHLPGSAGHEVVYADSFAQGKAVRELTIEEIYDLIEKFAEGAWRCQQAGFDAVELHGAHGYLIAQFMSPYVNKRNDRFGGTFLDRMRFPLEIIDRIKRKCGPDFAVGIRYSAEEYMPGSRTLEESCRVAEVMEQHGVAWIDVSMGIFEVPGPTMDPMYYQQGWATFASVEIKKHVHIPVITTHSLRDPDYCEKILAEGKADMVGLSRQLIADPYWGNKAKAGQPEKIRKCISCLVGCWQESLMIKRDIRCAINPYVGDECFYTMIKADQSFNLAIVGGGPAGLEAARIALLRGHKVTIFEKTGELGGAILLCCSIPGFSKMKWYADWIRSQIKELGADVRLNTEPQSTELEGYDAVFLAQGAEVVRPDIPGIENDMVVDFQNILRCKSTSCEYFPSDRQPPVETGERVLVFGNSFGAINSAELLARKGKSVIVVTPQREFVEWYEPCHRDVLMKRLNGGNGEGLSKEQAFEHPVQIIRNSTLYEIKENGEVVLMDKNFQKQTVNVDNVVLTETASIVSPLYEELREKGIPVQIMGDQAEVKNLRGAVTAGANAGLTLDEGLCMNANNQMVAKLPFDVL